MQCNAELLVPMALLRNSSDNSLRTSTLDNLLTTITTISPNTPKNALSYSNCVTKLALYSPRANCNSYEMHPIAASCAYSYLDSITLPDKSELQFNSTNLDYLQLALNLKKKHQYAIHYTTIRKIYVKPYETHITLYSTYSTKFIMSPSAAEIVQATCTRT